MPNITASIPHQLTRAEAKQRVQDQIAIVRQRHGNLITNVQETWTDDTLQFSVAAAGQSIAGHLTFDDQMLHLTVALPWLLSLLAGTIKHRIESEGRQLLGLKHDSAGRT